MIRERKLTPQIMMKLKAWMETYLHRPRRGKNKDKKRAKGQPVPTKTTMTTDDGCAGPEERLRKQTSEDDRLNGNASTYNDNTRKDRSLTINDSGDEVKRVGHWTTAYEDVRRTPLLGLRSAAYSRSISSNTKQVSACNCSMSPEVGAQIRH